MISNGFAPDIKTILQNVDRALHCTGFTGAFTVELAAYGRILVTAHGRHCTDRVVASGDTLGEALRVLNERLVALD